MKNFALAAAIITALTACAERPDAIAPISMAGAFNNVSCSNAQQMLNDERATLAAMSAAQETAATTDAVGVFLIGIPMSSVGGGDKAGEIAASKGKVLALENRLASCR